MGPCKYRLNVLFLTVISCYTGFSQSVETKPPNTNYKSAFAGQTRIASVKTTTLYRVDKIAQKLGAPFAIVGMPDGRLMVTLKSGFMEIHDANGKLVKKITGLPAVVYVGQGGLLDVA